MKLVCKICGLSICTISYIFCKILYNQSLKLSELDQQLKYAQKQLNNYIKSGAIQKVEVCVKSFPNETQGLKSLICNNEWILPEEVEKRTDILYMM